MPLALNPGLCLTPSGVCLILARFPRPSGKRCVFTKIAMPVYEYRCGACGHEFEEWQKISEPPIKTCPTCKKKKVERLISATSFVLKGGGWYKDLYSAKPGSSESKGDSESAASSDSKGDAKSDKSESKSDSKADSKSDKSDKKAESKPAKSDSKSDSKGGSSGSSKGSSKKGASA